MATRRKKASTRVPSGQVRKAKAQKRPRKVAEKPPKGAKRVSSKKRSVAKTAAKASSKPKNARAGGKAPTPERKPKRASQGKGMRAKGQRKGTRKATRKPRKKRTREVAFATLRKQALKPTKKHPEGRIPSASFLRRSGKSTLRGTEGRERSLSVREEWGQVREGHIAEKVRRAYAGLTAELPSGPIPPSLYARFTFTVDRVKGILTGGSPKVLAIAKRKVTAWFYSTGLAYSLESAMAQFERAWDAIDESVREAMGLEPRAVFFLEFVTVIAYRVKH